MSELWDKERGKKKSSWFLVENNMQHWPNNIPRKKNDFEYFLHIQTQD